VAPLPLHTWLAGAATGGQNAAGACVVVVDVLRATSTVAAALANGAAGVIPRADVDEAFAARAELERRGEAPVLGGERGGFKVAGFDLGNSPLEYGPERVADRPVILCTSNGTAALERYRGASHLYAASFVNAGATAAAVARRAEAVTLCCAGKEGAPALEDACCAGLIAELLLDVYSYDADDATAMAVLCWQRHRGDLGRLLRTCHHGRHLAGLGFDRDLEFCGRVDALSVVAAQRDGEKLVAVTPDGSRGQDGRRK
jgi:2-phosphosulfolactate phosphatase